MYVCMHVCLLIIFRHHTIFKLLTPKVHGSYRKNQILEKSDTLMENLQNFAMKGFMH